MNALSTRVIKFFVFPVKHFPLFYSFFGPASIATWVFGYYHVVCRWIIINLVYSYVILRWFSGDLRVPWLISEYAMQILGNAAVNVRCWWFRGRSHADRRPVYKNKQTGTACRVLVCANSTQVFVIFCFLVYRSAPYIITRSSSSIQKGKNYIDCRESLINCFGFVHTAIELLDWSSSYLSYLVPV